MKIANYLNKKLVFFMHTKTKEETLKLLISNTLDIKNLSSSDQFYNAIWEREKIVSTGIGMGVAIPHAKLASYHDFFVAIGVLERGIDWHAIDNTPVRLVFLIGGPDDRQTEYLQILSALTTMLRDENLRKDMLGTQNGEEIIKLFEGL
jgi:PTS system nitrogen regulatory IIA component